uniref:Lens epithelium-derived growth factor integrase-binding domain-containing protein n=1 Tax=Timema tahoe TaxID=61484 RepID=A0A7R9IA83_9NEOP|nr:unnamed protein product [Timema tahoe]
MSESSILQNKAARDRWDEACWINAQKLKQQIEDESYIPESLKKQLEERIKLREHEIRQLGLENDSDSFDVSYGYLNTEARLMELDALIKSKLSLIKADPEKCLSYLTELGDLDVQPLMLKKHPHTVDTIKKKLFVIPENKTFYQVFSEEVNKLKEHTVNMDDMEFYKLREEPSEGGVWQSDKSVMGPRIEPRTPSTEARHLTPRPPGHLL